MKTLILKSKKLDILTESIKNIILTDDVQVLKCPFLESDGDFVSVVKTNDNFDPSKINSNIITKEDDDDYDEKSSKKVELINKAKEEIKDTLDDNKDLKKILDQIEKINKETQSTNWQVNKENNTAYLDSKDAQIFIQNNNILLSYDDSIKVFKNVEELHNYLRLKGLPLPKGIKLHESLMVEKKTKSDEQQSEEQATNKTKNEIQQKIDEINELINKKNEEEKKWDTMLSRPGFELLVMYDVNNQIIELEKQIVEIIKNKTGKDISFYDLVEKTNTDTEAPVIVEDPEEEKKKKQRRGMSASVENENKENLLTESFSGPKNTWSESEEFVNQRQLYDYIRKSVIYPELILEKKFKNFLQEHNISLKDFLEKNKNVIWEVIPKNEITDEIFKDTLNYCRASSDLDIAKKFLLGELNSKKTGENSTRYIKDILDSDDHILKLAAFKGIYDPKDKTKIINQEKLNDTLQRLKNTYGIVFETNNPREEIKYHRYNPSKPNIPANKLTNLVREAITEIHQNENTKSLIDKKFEDMYRYGKIAIKLGKVRDFTEFLIYLAIKNLKDKEAIKIKKPKSSLENNSEENKIATLLYIIDVNDFDNKLNNLIENNGGLKNFKEKETEDSDTTIIDDIKALELEEKRTLYACLYFKKHPNGEKNKKIIDILKQKYHDENNELFTNLGDLNFYIDYLDSKFKNYSLQESCFDNKNLEELKESLKEMIKNIFANNTKMLKEDDTPADFASGPSTSTNINTSDSSADMNSLNDLGSEDEINQEQPADIQSPDAEDLGGDLSMGGMGGLDGYTPESEEQDQVPLSEPEPDYKIIDVLMSDKDNSEIRLKLKNMDTGEIEIKPLSEIDV